MEIELDFTPLQALLFPEQVLQVLGLVSGQTRRLVSAAPPYHWSGGCPPKSAAGQTSSWSSAPLKVLKNRFYRKIGQIDWPLAWTTRRVRSPPSPHEVSRETAKF